MTAVDRWVVEYRERMAWRRWVWRWLGAVAVLASGCVLALGVLMLAELLR